MITHLPERYGYHAQRLEVVQACIGSMTKSAQGTPLVVWDNGSHPSMVEWLRSLKPYILIESANVGKINARTALFRMFPPTTIVAASDDDILYYPGWLEAELEILRAFPIVACVSGNPIRTSFRWGCRNTMKWMQDNAKMQTAYCGCKQCCSWGRGSWKYLKLDFWNRYYVIGPDEGKPYSGHTASGSKPREPNPGLISFNSITHPWMIPVRILFPWLWFPYPGTIAADTKYYPFGTEMYVPGYGDGVVEDRGSAIKGKKRIDLYFNSHGKAREWGRQTLEVEIKE